MGEFDCTTVVMEMPEPLTPPSASCQEDFDVRRLEQGLRVALLLGSRVLIPSFATCSVSMRDLGIARVPPWPTSSVLLEESEAEERKSLSLAEARLLARELQERIDRDYEKVAESDARLEAVWEEKV